MQAYDDVTSAKLLESVAKIRVILLGDWKMNLAKVSLVGNICCERAVIFFSLVGMTSAKHIQ